MVKSINQTFSVFSQLYSALHDKQFETWFLIAYIAQEFHCSRKTCLYYQQLCPWLFFQILEPFYGVTNFKGSVQWNSRSLSHVQQLNSTYMCPVCALAFHYLTPFFFSLTTMSVCLLLYCRMLVPFWGMNLQIVFIDGVFEVILNHPFNIIELLTWSLLCIFHFWCYSNIILIQFMLMSKCNEFQVTVECGCASQRELMTKY